MQYHAKNASAITYDLPQKPAMGNVVKRVVAASALTAADVITLEFNSTY